MKTKSAVMQMFYGERGNGELVECSKEYYDQMGTVGELQDELRAKLADAPELLQLLEKFCESLEAAHADEVEAYYEEGFNFGLVMGVQAGKS